MNDRQREQIGRIIAQFTNANHVNLSLSLAKVRDEFGLAGRGGSGMMIVKGAQEVDRISLGYLQELVTRIAAVSRTPAAFDEVESAFRRWLRGCEDDLMTFAGSVRDLRLQGSGHARAVCETELEKVKASLEQRLEIEGYDFQQGDPKPVSEPVRKQGGRPPAEFWDDMWAATATALYVGTLKPKTQADVERAMADWIEANGYSAADSTIRARARRLWDRLASTDA